MQTHGQQQHAAFSAAAAGKRSDTRACLLQVPPQESNLNAEQLVPPQVPGRASDGKRYPDPLQDGVDTTVNDPEPRWVQASALTAISFVAQASKRMALPEGWLRSCAGCRQGGCRAGNAGAGCGQDLSRRRPQPVKDAGKHVNSNGSQSRGLDAIGSGSARSLQAGLPPWQADSRT